MPFTLASNTDIVTKVQLLYWDLAIGRWNGLKAPTTLRITREDDDELNRWVALNGPMTVLGDWGQRRFMGLTVERDAVVTEVL